jgi:galactoside O-acetyltransferase
VDIGDFSGLSARCSVFSSGDDFSGTWLVGPTVPDRLRGVTQGAVVLEAHVFVGAGTVILPGVRIGESASIGALSLVKEDVDPFTIMAGVPARLLGERRAEHRALADRWLEERSDP